MSLTGVWKSATTPTVRDAEAARREAVLLNALATFFVMGLFALAAQMMEPLTEPLTALWPLWVALVAALTAGAAFSTRLARRGHHRAVAAGMITVLLLFSWTMLAVAGTLTPAWVLMSVYCLMLAAFLLGGRAAFTVLLVTVLVAVAGDVLQAAGTIPLTHAYETTADRHGPNSLALILIGSLIAQTCWHFTRENRRSIDEELTDESPASPLARLRTKRLTLREVEVVRLVAEGLQDDQIARQLVISSRTVHTHVANALAKTGCGNRTELGVLAVREGLAPLAAARPPDLSAGSGVASGVSAIRPE